MKCPLKQIKINNKECWNCLFCDIHAILFGKIYTTCGFEKWIKWINKGKMNHAKPTNLI